MNVRVFLNHFGSRMPVGILAQQGHEILFQYVNFQKSGNRDLKKIISYSVFSLS